MSISVRATSVISAFFFAIFNFTVLASVKPYFAVWCSYLFCRLFPFFTCPLWHLFFRFHVFASSKTLFTISTLLPAVVIFNTIWVNFSCFEVMHFFMTSMFFFTYTSLAFFTCTFFTLLAFTFTFWFFWFWFCFFGLLVLGWTSIHRMCYWLWWNNRNSLWFDSNIQGFCFLSYLSIVLIVITINSFDLLNLIGCCLIL